MTTARNAALIVEAEDELFLAEDLITLQVVHDKLDGAPALLTRLPDAHPGPAVCPVPPPPSSRLHKAR